MRIHYLLLLSLFGVGCRLPGGDRDRQAEPRTADNASSAYVAPVTDLVQVQAQVPAADAADHLADASYCVERGEHARAANHLRLHLKAHPEQIMIRAYLAELLLKARQLAEAQEQFDLFIADAQLTTGPGHKHILHCHTRLLEIAQDRDDEYSEHLHRGIGMVLLARQLEANPSAEEHEAGFRERILCKAAAELTLAAKLRPDEPRPHCYLFETWTKLQQARQAERSLKRAQQMAALLHLPPGEYRTLLAAR